MKVLIKEKISPHKSKTPEGYLICRDAILGRTGTQEYRASEIYSNYDGEDKIVNVIRDAKEVFSDQAIASFENKPVTCEHPDEDVTPDNYKEYSVGFVRDVHKGNVNGEDVLLGNLIITDADIINDIENGIRTELSCGYTCDITSGEHPSQVNIRGNHVALCEQGRAGCAKIVDSIPAAVKGLVFKSDHDIPAKSDLTFTEGIYKVGRGLYVLIFFNGTHQTKQEEIVNKYNAKEIQPFAISVIEDAIDGYDLDRITPEDLSVKLKLAAQKHFGTHKFLDSEGQHMPKLPKKLKDKLQDIFAEKSTFVKDPNYDAYKFVKEVGEKFYVDGKSLTFTRESIDGWKRMGDGMMRKDYIFSVDGYDNKFLLSIYADPNTYNTTEVNAYFLDSEVKDELIKSKSKEALKKNIATEITAGKDPKQATAIAYSVQRKAKAKDAVKITEADIVPGMSFARVGFPNKEFKVVFVSEGKVKIQNPRKEIETAELDNLLHDFNVGEFAIVFSGKDAVDITYDTYRDYDIDKVGDYFEVVFDGSPAQFKTYEAALEYIDNMLDKTEQMLRDRAIRDREYSPYFKKEIRKELARAKAEIEEEEAPDDDHARMGFRKAKNSLLAHLKEAMKQNRND